MSTIQHLFETSFMCTRAATIIPYPVLPQETIMEKLEWILLWLWFLMSSQWKKVTQHRDNKWQFFFTFQWKLFSHSRDAFCQGSLEGFVSFWSKKRKLLIILTKTFDKVDIEKWHQNISRFQPHCHKNASTFIQHILLMILTHSV